MLPNIISTTTGYNLFSLVVISCNKFEDSIDHNIIHEFNHLFELYLNEAFENHYRITCGWDINELKINNKEVQTVDTLNKDNSSRNTEKINKK